MIKFAKKSRREFIKVCSIGTGGLFLAAYIPIGCGESEPEYDPNILSPSAYIKIDTNGIVTVFVHRAEMGQGISTSLPMIVAEELEVDWKDIRVVLADADEKYGEQMTTGSRSIRLFFDPFRIAAASAKEMLLTAASIRWGIDVSDCYSQNGFILNKLNASKFSFGELVTEAAKLPVPQNVKLKDPKDYKVIGKRIKRLDSPAKVYGTAKFGLDITVPGMVYAAIKRPPTFKGSVKSFNASKAKAVKGVLDVIQISRGVAIIADSTWNAFKGQELVEVDWDPGPFTGVSNESIRESFLAKLDTAGTEYLKTGDPENPEFKNEKILTALYELPFLVHAPMEPVNCVADVKSDRAEIWAPTQNPRSMQSEIANMLGFRNIFTKVLGLKGKDVIVHVTFLGGGFGRKSHSDFGLEAAEISQAIGKPVKLTWTRDDDMKHGQFRPASMHNLKGAVNKSGKAVMFSHHIIGPSIKSNLMNKEPERPQDNDDMVDGANPLYNIPNIYVSASNVSTPVPLWYWRAVYYSQNPIVVESFIDEMAAAAKKDPIDFRLEMLEEGTRLTNVLRLAREKSNWDRKLPEGSGRGVALFSGLGSFNAQVAEVTVKNNKIKLDRFVSVIDCGIAINPDTIEAQMEGSIIFALSAALKGEIIIRKGRIENSNFFDYPILEYGETPIIETHIIKNDLPVGGVGEVGIAAAAPALLNAIFNATGKRVRKLPVNLSEIG